MLVVSLPRLRRGRGEPAVRHTLSRRSLLVAAAIVLLLTLLLHGTGYRYREVPLPPGGSAPPAELARLRAAIARTAPRGTYIVVDQRNNRLYLRDRGGLEREAVCSTGSGMLLRDGHREWVFNTPQGRFKVRTKLTNPVWKRPDWAFIEEGEPIPSDPGERMEYGVLGEYGLYFGNGYLIHGTLYERLLGRSVTHGCVRLGRDDLRAVYAAAPVGTPIFIY